MKSVIVKLQIQFDIFGEGDQMKKVQEALDIMNTELQGLHLISSPQMFVNNIADEDIEIADEEFEEESDLVTLERAPIWAEISEDHVDDSEGEKGTRYIDAYLTDNFDEVSKTIAKIDNATGEVEYIDDRAKTDTNAQEEIQYWILSALITSLVLIYATPSQKFIDLAELLLQMIIERQEYNVPESFKMPEAFIIKTATIIEEAFKKGAFSETNGQLYYSGMTEDYGGHFHAILTDQFPN